MTSVDLRTAAYALSQRGVNIVLFCYAIVTAISTERVSWREIAITLRTSAGQFDNDLSGTLRLTNFVPPDREFRRAIPHLQQFLLDRQQAACAHI